ncbi:MAG TPA: protein kinase [Ignavibacteriaceae bacterium]|nr:protein kinase [Ignavibacteriaceae bacterium]
MINETISHYSISEKLGGGGMGVVYKAEDTKLRRTVALKFLPASFSYDEEAKQRFLYEAYAASSIQHHNICNIHDIDETEDGRLFICMDYYDGKTLKQKIAEGPLKINSAIDISLQVAHGLLKTHEQKIIHRDIKPANIFVTKDGTVKILDFGLAKLSGQVNITKMGSTLGTAAYMSPEQAIGNDVDHRTDIWSLGIVMYEMITGKTPFQSDFEQAVLYSILNEEPEPISSLRGDVPVELERIIFKALGKDPEERYQHIEEMIIDLRNINNTEQRNSLKRFNFNKKKKSKNTLYWSAAIIILLTSVFALWRFLDTTYTKMEKRKLIAVLPFKSISDTEDNRDFTDGIHDDIIIQLSKIGELKVIARSSVLEYQESKKPVKQIASELGAGSILEGSTRRSNDLIRVNARLVDPETGEYLWADTYDRPYKDIFEIQSDLAQKIATALQIKLGAEELVSLQTEPTENMIAWDYYRKGKYFWEVSYNFDGNLKSAEMFTIACSLDSSFTLAWIFRSMAYSVVAGQSPSFEERLNYIKEAELSLQKARQTGKEMPEYHLARGHYYYHIKNNLDSAIIETEIADQIRPNDSNTLYFLSILVSDKGDWKRGYDISERIFQLNPKGTGGLLLGAWSAFGLGLYDESEVWADKLINIDPESGLGYVLKTRTVLLGKGEVERAQSILNEAKKFTLRDTYHLSIYQYLIHLYKKEFKKAVSVFEDWNYPIRWYFLGIAYNLMNNQTKAKTSFDSSRVIYIDLLSKHPDNKKARLRLAMSYAALNDKTNALLHMAQTTEDSRRQLEIDYIYFNILIGEHDFAVKLLKKYIQDSTELTSFMIKNDPRLDALRKRRDFQEALKMISDG